MAAKERKQKNVIFGIPKDDDYEVELSSFNYPREEEGSSFSSTRDYWQSKTTKSSSGLDAKHESLYCEYFWLLSIGHQVELKEALQQ